jgi:hypothetical protein
VASLEHIKDANEMPLLDGAPRAAVRDRLRASALEERGATGLAEHTCIQGAGGFEGAGGFGALVLAPVDAMVVVSDLDAAAVGVADKSARDHGVGSTRS